MDPEDLECRTQVFKTWVDLRIALSLWRNPIVMVTAKPERWGMYGPDADRWSIWVGLFREVFGGGSTISGIRPDVIVLEGDLHWSEQKQRHNDPDANAWRHADSGWRTLAALRERTIIRQATLRRLISINPMVAFDLQNTVLDESAHNWIMRIVGGDGVLVARHDPRSVGEEDAAYRWHISPRVDDSLPLPEGVAALAASEVNRGVRKERSPSREPARFKNPVVQIPIKSALSFGVQVCPTCFTPNNTTSVESRGYCHACFSKDVIQSPVVKPSDNISGGQCPMCSFWMPCTAFSAMVALRFVRSSLRELLPSGGVPVHLTSTRW